MDIISAVSPGILIPEGPTLTQGTTNNERRHYSGLQLTTAGYLGGKYVFFGLSGDLSSSLPSFRVLLGIPPYRLVRRIEHRISSRVVIHDP